MGIKTSLTMAIYQRIHIFVLDNKTRADNNAGNKILPACARRSPAAPILPERLKCMWRLAGDSASISGMATEDHGKL